MKVKASEATPLQLNWLVAKCEGRDIELIGVKDDDDPNLFWHNANNSSYQYSTNWAQGGPIIERERINVRDEVTQWSSWMWDSTRCGDVSYYGPTPLIAAMRCYVASKLGDEIEIPEELR